MELVKIITSYSKIDINIFNCIMYPMVIPTFKKSK